MKKHIASMTGHFEQHKKNNMLNARALWLGQYLCEHLQ